MACPADLPVFSMWETLSETISALTNTKASERSIEHLSKIIKSRNFSNIFVYNGDPSQSFEEYQRISVCYKSFTTWVLGRMFYMLSCEPVTTSHNNYVNIQLSILNQIANSQLHFYCELVDEYYKIFNTVTQFMRSGGENKLFLDPFKALQYVDICEKLNLSQNPIEVTNTNQDVFILHLFDFINSFIAHSEYREEKLYKDLIYLLSEKSFRIKMKVIEVFLTIRQQSGPNTFFESERQVIASLIEQLIYIIFDNKIILNNNKKSQFEALISIFLKNNKREEQIYKICKFIFEKSLGDGALIPSQDLQKTCEEILAKSEVSSIYFKDISLAAFKKHKTFAFCGLKRDILDTINKLRLTDEGIQEAHIYELGQWGEFYKLLLEDFRSFTCTTICKLEESSKFLYEIFKIFTEIRIQFAHELRVIFVDEIQFFIQLLQIINQHFSGCSIGISYESIYELFLQLANIFYDSTLLVCIFNIFSARFSRRINQTIKSAQHKSELNQFLQYIPLFTLESDIVFGYLTQFLVYVSCGFAQLIQIQDMETIYIEIIKNEKKFRLHALKKLPHLLTIFNNENIISDILLSSLHSQEEIILKETVRILPNIICICNSNFCKIMKMNAKDGLNVQIQCKKCVVFRTINSIFPFQKLTVDFSSVSGTILNRILRLLSFSNSELNILLLDALPFCSNHFEHFFLDTISNIWLEKCGDQDRKVRLKCGEIIASISSQAPLEFFDSVFTVLLNLTKKAIRESNFELQETILDNINKVCMVCPKNDKILLSIVKILIYLIMIPNSKYKLIAVSHLYKVAEVNQMTARELYKSYKQEICDFVVHLCVVNHLLIDYRLSNSLAKMSTILEYFSLRDYLLKECHYLLPFFVARVIKTPSVTKLIEEISSIVNTTTNELISSTYGNIFLYTFLNLSTEDFKLCLNYVEEKTGLSRQALFKRNLSKIVNELLLNFHSKREKVLQALKLLAAEDAKNKNIQDYLQPRLLGVLQHFDFNLVAKNLQKKSNVLESLVDLLTFMEAKRITPLRFKIIAMLRTADCDVFPELICDVWTAFIRNCEVESLAPQLATISVSILPLIKVHPSKINAIFEYLIVQNQSITKDYIQDLFFIDDKLLSKAILDIIQNHVKNIATYSLRDQFKLYLKYSNHETYTVRVKSLKKIKLLVEKSREELDKMILGYNGIDSVIVELINSLTIGLKETDVALKLTCGEVLGELGAVEPSHLPRKYAQNVRQFVLFVDDDEFLVGAINELTRALQGEKNTVNMDRFAVGIQEILKTFEIAPGAQNNRQHLWNSLPDWQRELIFPLLTSRYIITHTSQSTFPCPVYGSFVGLTFQTWLYNWTCSMVDMLSREHQALVNPCLLAIKQDQKILMWFLPYILLHCIIGGSQDDRDKIFKEIKTVTSLPTGSKKIDTELLNTRLIPMSHVALNEFNIQDDVKQTQCSTVIFVLVDFLERWVREWQWLKGVMGRNDENFLKIQTFLQRLSKLELSHCNFEAGEYPRALLYLEDYFYSNPEEMPNHLAFMAKIYAQLDEPDGVAGVTAFQKQEPSIEQRILTLEMSGKLSDAAACYESLTQPLSLNHLKGLIQCYLDLDNVNIALNLAQGALYRESDFGLSVLETQAEPLWRLGRYDDLDNLLNDPKLKTPGNNWGVEIGRAFSCFQREDTESFTQVIDKLRYHQVELFGAASVEKGCYQQGYSYISRLHALNELQHAEAITRDILLRPENEAFIITALRNLAREWELRIKVVQDSTKIIEPLLCLRRVIIEQIKRRIGVKAPSAIPHLNSLLGECWLLSATTARKAGIYQQAYTYTLKAEEYAPLTLFIEKAQLFWMREEHEEALMALKRGVETINSNNTQLCQLSLEKKKICAEAKLLIAFYSDTISSVDNANKLSFYKESLDIYKEWENSWVKLAQFYDRRLQSYTDEEKDTKGSALQIRIIDSFTKSLRFGSVFVYQSMPRLLQVWFDYGTRLLGIADSALLKERHTNLVRMTLLINQALETLPPYIFLTCFSQLVSRICHPQKEVHVQLKSIIVKLLLHYPQHSLWMMISVMKSSYSVRKKRCAEIFADTQLKTNTMSKLIADFTTLAEKLIDLCNKDVPQDVETTTVSSLLRSLPRLLKQSNFSQIMIPTQRFRKLVLPNPDFASTQHNPFPNYAVHIVGIAEEVTILRSLQRPRKITFRGSDGKGYVQMLKPKDDLRKDFRLMEFNDIVNQLLSRESESRQRRLNIRLYSVSPLNEECGLIEWIPNLLGLRPILQTIYKQRGVGMSGRELKESSCSLRDSLARKRDIFTKVFVAKHPPVLGEWFRRTFPDAQSWVFARLAYVRTTAVISIVGYILGLGDRHGENILFDSICGDTVHVDFNCLFNKGETFDWPERVPFRLTHNMVSAMGPLGVEGMFRKACACTLKVLRDNKNTLMSIVTPFVYDPLVSWPRNVSSGSSAAERTNEQAVDHIKNIERRLEGITTNTAKLITIPLSVDGQANILIQEAMDIDNLCQMYIGWGAYL